jgi:cytochrome P450
VRCGIGEVCSHPPIINPAFKTGYTIREKTMFAGAAEQSEFIASRFDPLGESYLADPYPSMAEARAAAPVFYSERIDHWVVTRYHDIRSVFLNPSLFSAVNANSPLRPPCPAAAKALEDGQFATVRTLANADPPAHTRVRRIVNAAFTPKRVAEMEPFIRETVKRFLKERFRNGRADFVRDLAWELPVLVLFRILGVADTEIGRVKKGSWNRILFIYGHPDNEADQVGAAHGLAEFWRYAQSLVDDRQREQRDDFTSALVHAKDEHGEGLTSQQSATVVLNLLFAGHETTTAILGNSLRRLLGDRQVWNDIVQDASLIPNAVEEVLRLDSSVIAWRRRATEATQLAGVSLPKDANLLLLLGSGNRDPAVFANPDRLDIRRSNAKDHLAFGYGVHLCVGRPLARLQARVVLEELSSVIPSLRLVPDVRYEFPPNVSFRGPLSLPVEWDA